MSCVNSIRSETAKPATVAPITPAMRRPRSGRCRTSIPSGTKKATLRSTCADAGFVSRARGPSIPPSFAMSPTKANRRSCGPAPARQAAATVPSSGRGRSV
ncbi:hypothetical protein C5C18_08325 [Rathayibacter tritici]|nr:hypothetical protein C5C06_13480 [Rathayibacter tritici]PPF62553.1 hypothetical protein C5C21_14070 [Rathayibacter tritici]PPG06994.1 hypothetical protein C5C18_08325 [Rathayibacter tritici]PPI19681.1 hypothetical protein C5D07_01345 [Rathayibacter tritici]PPI49422.1 hypothetical protein C5D18_01505 [Rathayibacter tritici]